MLTATRLGAIETGDIVELLPALINASTTVSNAVNQMTTSVTGAVDRLATLPEQVISETKTGIREIGYTAGYGFGRGVGWGALPPVLIGAGLILAGLLAYRYTAIRVEKRAELMPAYAR